MVDFSPTFQLWQGLLIIHKQVFKSDGSKLQSLSVRCFVYIYICTLYFQSECRHDEEEVLFFKFCFNLLIYINHVFFKEVNRWNHGDSANYMFCMYVQTLLSFQTYQSDVMRQRDG